MRTRLGLPAAYRYAYFTGVFKLVRRRVDLRRRNMHVSVVRKLLRTPVQCYRLRLDCKRQLLFRLVIVRVLRRRYLYSYVARTHCPERIVGDLFQRTRAVLDLVTVYDPVAVRVLLYIHFEHLAVYCAVLSEFYRRFAAVDIDRRVRRPRFFGISSTIYLCIYRNRADSIGYVYSVLDLRLYTLARALVHQIIMNFAVFLGLVTARERRANLQCQFFPVRRVRRRDLDH